MSVIYMQSLQTNNVPSRLSPQGFCGNLRTLPHDVRFMCPELPQSHCGNNRRTHCFHDYIYVYIYIYIYIYI